MMTTEEPKKSSEERRTKNEELLAQIPKEYGEAEEEFQGSPSFRFDCRNIPSFDSEDSITLSGFHRSSECHIFLGFDDGR
jgi:hypothetical protein